MRVAPVATVLVFGAFILTANGQEGIHWGYEGEAGPVNWGKLSDEFAACETGTQQSPINLTSGVEADLADIELRWNVVEWEVVNNGHTIQVQAPFAGTAIIDDEPYQLLQFHFHTPSEHAIDGERFPMEAHFVHAHEDGRLAVIGVMMEAGDDNELFGAIMAAAPTTEGEAALDERDAVALIPGGDDYLRYQGSLTTPPCSEVVLWTVMDETIEVSQADIDAFSALFPMNARPLQALARRYILIND